MLNVHSTTILMVIVKKTEFCKHLRYKMRHVCIAKGTKYLNCTNMYPLGFNGLIDCRLLNIFEPGVCAVWIMGVMYSAYCVR